MVLLGKKLWGPKPNPVKLRDQLEDQSSDNDEVERINEADIPRTSAQANEDIISEDEDIELESNNKIDTLKKKLNHRLDNVDKKRFPKKLKRSLLVKKKIYARYFRKEGLILKDSLFVWKHFFVFFNY